MPVEKLAPLLSHTVFSWASGVSAAVSLVLPLLAVLMYQPGQGGLRSAHTWAGTAFLVTSLVAALSGYRYGREARRKGLFPHAIGVFVAGLLQFTLGELGYTWVHVVLGILITLGAVALFAMSLRHTTVVTAGDTTSRG